MKADATIVFQEFDVILPISLEFSLCVVIPLNTTQNRPAVVEPPSWNAALSLANPSLVVGLIPSSADTYRYNVHNECQCVCSNYTYSSK